MVHIVIEKYFSFISKVIILFTDSPFNLTVTLLHLPIFKIGNPVIKHHQQKWKEHEKKRRCNNKLASNLNI